MKDYLGYQGKTCVITGCSSGMGLSTVQVLNDLGANVYALDLREVKEPVKKYIPYDQGSRAAIDKAVAQLPDKIDKVFCCAAVAGKKSRGATFTSTQVVTINFIGTRYFIDSVTPRLPAGGAIGVISSTAGFAWSMFQQDYAPLMAIDDWDKAVAWVADYAKREAEVMEGGIDDMGNVDGAYTVSKMLVSMWIKYRAYQLSAKGIRLNNTSPSGTATPLSADFGPGGENASLIKRVAQPMEQALPLVFINSEMATYISGADLLVDFAMIAGFMSGEKKY